VMFSACVISFKEHNRNKEIFEDRYGTCKVRQQPYDIVNNNCEHFATEMCLGVPYSFGVTNILIASVAAVASAGFVALEHAKGKGPMTSKFPQS
jgi:hypothetical protein